MAKVLKEDWRAVAQGEIYPVLHVAGAELKGELAERAERLGKLVDGKAKGKADAKAKADAEEEAARKAEADRLAAEEEAARKAAEGGAA